MRAIARRLARIEERIRPAADTEHLRRLRERLDAARQRIARWGYAAQDLAPNREDTRGWTLVERLQRGRQRSVLAN
jgi:predicted  nucleic acid-binding Zn-ribbon protein